MVSFDKKNVIFSRQDQPYSSFNPLFLYDCRDINVKTGLLAQAKPSTFLFRVSKRSAHNTKFRFYAESFLEVGFGSDLVDKSLH